MSQSNSAVFVVSGTSCDDHAHTSYATFAKVSGDTCVPVDTKQCTFRVAWKINVHMEVGAANPQIASRQHLQFRKALRQAGATLIEVPFVHGAYDSVFTKDNAILGRQRRRKKALLGRFACRQRQAEQRSRREELEKLNFEVEEVEGSFLEGGDLVTASPLEQAFLGFGFRTSREAASKVESFLQKEVIPLELRDPHFYHLDTALGVLKDGTVMACRDAFTESSWKELERSTCIKRLIPIPREEALQFALNWVEIGNTLVVGGHSPIVSAHLASLGRRVLTSHLNEFHLAGGSAACLTAPLHDLNVSNESRSWAHA